MASTDYRPIRHAPYRIRFALRDTAGGMITGVTPTVNISEDDASFASVSGTAVEIGSSGVYYLDLTAGEFDSDSIVIRANGFGSVWTVIEVRTEPALDSGVATAGTATSITLRGGASSLDDYYNGATIELVKGTGRGQTRTIVDYVGSTKVVTVDRDFSTNPDTATVYKIIPAVSVRLEPSITTRANVDEIDGNAVSATAMNNLYKGATVDSSINDAGASTTSFVGAVGLSPVDDWYNNALMNFTSGNVAGLSRKITDYEGSARRFTITPALPVAPNNGVTFVILGNIV